MRYQRLKQSFALATIISAIGKDDVAAGLGAFRTCNMRFFSSPVFTVSKTKSSTRFPSLDNACARIPLGPLKMQQRLYFILKPILPIITTLQHH